MKLLKSFDINDGLILVGIAGLGIGLGMVSPALAWSALGCILLAMGLAGAWNKGRREK